MNWTGTEQVTYVDFHDPRMTVGEVILAAAKWHRNPAAILLALIREASIGPTPVRLDATFMSQLNHTNGHRVPACEMLEILIRAEVFADRIEKLYEKGCESNLQTLVLLLNEVGRITLPFMAIGAGASGEFVFPRIDDESPPPPGVSPAELAEKFKAELDDLFTRFPPKQQT